MTDHTGGNAEDCPVCRPEIDKTVLYPWICSGRGAVPAGGSDQRRQPLLRCNHAHLRQPHGPHVWEPQPGMDPVHCPGHRPAAPADEDRRQRYAAALYAAAMHETAYEGTEWADVRMDDRVRFLNTADAVMAVADAETAQLRAQLDTQTEKAGDCAEMAKDQRRRADALAERLHAAEAALDRVRAIPRAPHASEQDGELGRAYTRGWQSVIAAIDNALDPQQ